MSRSRYVALMRGMNVGGKNKLAMKELAAIFAETGCSDVRTFIQSGNVIFSATARVAVRLPEMIAMEIESRFGLRVPVVVRSAEQMSAVLRENPFIRAGVDQGTLHVMFLADLPTAAQVAGLDPGRSAPDEFIVCGREIYLRLPNGGGRSKLTNQYFDSRLKTVSTVRNWRTVMKLCELVAAG